MLARSGLTLQSHIRILLSTEQDANTLASFGDQIMSSTEAVWPFKGLSIVQDAASVEGFHTKMSFLQSPKSKQITKMKT